MAHTQRRDPGTAGIQAGGGSRGSHAQSQHHAQGYQGEWKSYERTCLFHLISSSSRELVNFIMFHHQPENVLISPYFVLNQRMCLFPPILSSTRERVYFLLSYPQPVNVFISSYFIPSQKTCLFPPIKAGSWETLACQSSSFRIWGPCLADTQQTWGPLSTWHQKW